MIYCDSTIMIENSFVIKLKPQTSSITIIKQITFRQKPAGNWEHWSTTQYYLPEHLHSRWYSASTESSNTGWTFQHKGSIFHKECHFGQPTGKRGPFARPHSLHSRRGRSPPAPGPTAKSTGCATSNTDLPKPLRLKTPSKNHKHLGFSQRKPRFFISSLSIKPNYFISLDNVCFFVFYFHSLSGSKMIKIVRLSFP